jgi:hypothetical protein
MYNSRQILTLNSVADSNYQGKCDVGGFLIFEWTLGTFFFLIFHFSIIA